MDSLDWIALARAASQLPPPLPLRLLSPSTLAHHADLAQREWQLDTQGVQRTKKVVLGVKGGQQVSGVSSERVKEQLELVDLSGNGWRANERAQGKVLVLRILTSPVFTSSVQFVADDSGGRVAPVQVFRVPVSVDERGELEEWFPKGGFFAVKEPLARTSSFNSSSYAIRLSSPSDFLPLPPTHPLVLSVDPPFPPSALHRLSSVANDPEELREAAEKAVQEKRWVRAKEALEWALSASRLEGNKYAKEVKRWEAEVLSELAEVNLQLGLPRSTRKNALDALELLGVPLPSDLASSAPPAAAKTPSSDVLASSLLILCARAFYALEDYSSCISTLSFLPSSSAESTSLLSLARLRLSEQHSGPSPSSIRSVFLDASASYRFPLSRYLSCSSSFPPPPPPPSELSSFTHPSLSFVSLPGKGRSVVASAPIERGTLLMVSRPLSAVPPLPLSSKRLKHTVGLNVLTKTLDPPGVVECVAELEWLLALEERGAGERGVREVRREVEELWAGEAMGRVEPEGREKVRAGLDPARIEGAVTFNGFVVEDLASAPEPGDAPAPPSSSSSTSLPPPADDKDEAFRSPLALYPVTRSPSALNHSCLPNCSYTFISSSSSSSCSSFPSSSSSSPASPTSTSYRPYFVLRARHPLQAGEELTIDYVSPAFSSLEEREDKCKGHGFVCECGVCEEERGAGEERLRRRKEGEEEAWALAERLPTDGGMREKDGTLEKGVRRAKELHDSLASTYPSPPSSAAPRLALYAPLRLLSLFLSLSRLSRYPLALDAETKALEALGTVFAKEKKEGGKVVRLLEGPRARDTDATLSALECARLSRTMGDGEGERTWIRIARDIERGQANEELFDLRFGGWMGRKGLSVREAVWEGGGEEAARDL
ncbi:hypothetical protein JCM8547_002628 [Rhodosporidiobolus lusitaniae]